jgi:hypothetical protein
MVERSSSHKSDGRQSSAGHSAHSTRLNSLAFDTRSPALEGTTNVGPPPGLFLLGPLPSIIRCWLDKNFTNEALLYAAVCTGSYTSMLSSRLAHRLTQKSFDHQEKISLIVYFPEATFIPSSTRALDLIPSVPSISMEFEIFEASEDDTLQVVIGSDILRAKSAEILFGHDKLTMFDDEHNKLTIPMVRPENPGVFQNLRTTSSLGFFKAPTEYAPTFSVGSVTSEIDGREGRDRFSARSKSELDQERLTDPSTTRASTIVSKPSLSSLKAGTVPDDSLETPTTTRLSQDSPIRTLGNGIIASSKEKEAGMWGPWRKDQPQQDSFSNTVSNTGQKSVRGKGMKVLKPSRSSTSRSISSGQAISGNETPSKWQNHRTPTANDGGNITNSPRQSFSSDVKPPAVTGGKPRNANPVGGASAFAWLNPAQK